MKPTNRGWEKFKDVECISTNAVPVHTMMAWGVEVYLHSFLSSTPVEVICQIHAPAALPWINAPSAN